MTPPAPPWWAGVDPVEVRLKCGAQEHRLRWAEGRLVTPDHPEADRERALVALGGEPVACLELLDTWLAHADDLDLLVLTSRGASDPLLDPAPSDGARYSGAYSGKLGISGGIATTRVSARPRGPRRAGRGWASYGALNSGRRPHGQEAELDATLFAALGRGLTDRWVATVIATWTERIREADGRVSEATPKLRAALYGRVLTTIRTLESQDPVDLTMVGAGSSRSITEHGGRIRCELPFSWLGDVWARGFAAVLGHLCLNVERAADDDWQLLVVDPDLRRTRIMAIRLD